MVPSAGAITVLGLNGDRAQGLFPPYPTTGPCAMFFPLLAAFASYLLLIGPARSQVSAPSFSDSSFNWVGWPSPRRSFPINNNQFFASSWRFYSRLIRSNKIPAWSWRTWRPCATMAVSTCTFGASCAILSACAVFAIPALLPQHSYTGPSGVDNGDICKCNTVVYNLISACDACQGESWIPCVDQLCFPQDSSQLTYLFNQLLYVVVQLHNQSNSRNVCTVSFLLLVPKLNLPPQLPEPSPSWYASTGVGLHRHICTSAPRLLAQESASTSTLTAR